MGHRTSRIANERELRNFTKFRFAGLGGQFTLLCRHAHTAIRIRCKPSAVPKRHRNPISGKQHGLGRFFAGTSDLGVVVLPQWNCKWDGQITLCRVLQSAGITSLRLSLPYHHDRRPAHIERSEYLVSPNVGRTIAAVRQAVYDLSFLPALSRQTYDEIRRCDVPCEIMWLPCGHYTLGRFPFNAVAGYRIVRFLARVPPTA